MPSFDIKSNEECLRRHNELREAHGAPPLVSDAKLAEMAQKYAEKLAKSKKLIQATKSEAGGAGENLAMTKDEVLTAIGAVDMWYHEGPEYDYDNPGYSTMTARFTQLIWAESKSVGFGLARNGNLHFAVARYLPAGNVEGNYEKNVAPLIQGKLSDEEMQKVKEIFDQHTEEYDDAIAAEDLIIVLRATGQNPTAVSVEEAIEKYDVDKNSRLNFDEFMKLLNEIYQSKEERELRLRLAFDCFDNTGDGFIDKQELFQALTDMGEEALSYEEVANIFEMGDTDGDEKLNVNEYVNLFIV